MLTDKRLGEIRAEARAILDSFASALAKIPAPKETFDLNNGAGVRAENSGFSVDVEFKKIIFKNAPKHDDVCFIAEKGAWEK